MFERKRQPLQNHRVQQRPKTHLTQGIYIATLHGKFYRILFKHIHGNHFSWIAIISINTIPWVIIFFRFFAYFDFAQSESQIIYPTLLYVCPVEQPLKLHSMDIFSSENLFVRNAPGRRKMQALSPANNLFNTLLREFITIVDKILYKFCKHGKQVNTSHFRR